MAAADMAAEVDTVAGVGVTDEEVGGDGVDRNDRGPTATAVVLLVALQTSLLEMAMEVGAEAEGILEDLAQIGALIHQMFKILKRPLIKNLQPRLILLIRTLCSLNIFTIFLYIILKNVIIILINCHDYLFYYIERCHHNSCIMAVMID